MASNGDASKNKLTIEQKIVEARRLNNSIFFNMINNQNKDESCLLLLVIHFNEFSIRLAVIVS